MKHLLIISTIIITGLLGYFLTFKNDPVKSYSFVSHSIDNKLIPVNCWFTLKTEWPPVECYKMQVSEDHSSIDGKHINFPVIIFRSEPQSNKKAPLLHLGGGGPGGPMYLESMDLINDIWLYHDGISTNIGRDLFIIDPRGVGLSEPLLSCGHFVDNEAYRLTQNISLEEHIKASNHDIFKCLDDFQAEGIDLSTYNSFSIARDIEALRIATNVDQWVLLGVSYGSIYAQTIAELFPKSVEAMVLDSAAFSSIKLDHNFIQRMMDPYQKLFNYCKYNQLCTNPDKNIEKRIWALFEKLSVEPITVLLKDSTNNYSLAVSLNGNRFIDALLQGVYGTDIFYDLPKIINDLEAGRWESIEPYVIYYVSYLLDPTWGDISSIAHYCYEDRPFINFDKINNLINELSEGYIRNSAQHIKSANKFCNYLDMNSVAPVIVPTESIDIPTLFLHGRLDSVTPLDNVELSRDNFTNHYLLTFNKSHSIMNTDGCAEQLTSVFIETHQLKDHDINCGNSIRLHQ